MEKFKPYLFKGESIFEFNKPNIKKIIEIIMDQKFISPLFNNG